MKNILTTASILIGLTLASVNTSAQSATSKDGPPKPPAKIVQASETKAPVVSAPVAANDLHQTANEKLNNSEANMPKLVKANETNSKQQAKPAEVKLVDSRTVPVPSKPEEKKSSSQQQ